MHVKRGGHTRDETLPQINRSGILRTRENAPDPEGPRAIPLARLLPGASLNLGEPSFGLFKIGLDSLRLFRVALRPSFGLFRGFLALRDLGAVPTKLRARPVEASRYFDDFRERKIGRNLPGRDEGRLVESDGRFPDGVLREKRTANEVDRVRGDDDRGRNGGLDLRGIRRSVNRTFLS